MPKFSAMDIVVEKVTLVRGSNTRAKVDLRIIGLLRIRDLRVVQQPGEEPWVAPPTIDLFDAHERKNKHVAVIEWLDVNLKEAVSAAVIAAYAKGSVPHE